MRIFPILLLALPFAAGAVTVSTAEDAPLDVDALAVADGKVQGGPLTGRPASDLVQIVFAASQAPVPGKGKAKVEIRLLTGDVLWGTLLPADKDADAGALVLDTAVLGILRIPLDRVSTVVFAERLPGAALAALEDRLAADRVGMDHDLCYLASGGDRARFSLRTLDDRSVTGDDPDGRPLAFGVDKILAVSLMALESPPVLQGLKVQLTALDGSVLVGVLAALLDGKLTLAHPALGDLSIPLDRCGVLDVLSGRVTSLCDLKPVEVKERPYLYDASKDPASAVLFHWRADRQVADSRPLQIRGRTYARGLGVHSYSSLSYDLGGTSVRFRADVGIDDSAKGGGDAVAVVLLDGKEAFRQRILGRDPARRVDLDCRGARKLTLVVEFGEDREILDRVAWANPVLVKEAR